MIAGAAAFFLYSCLCIHLLVRHRWGATAASLFSFSAWFVGAFGLVSGFEMKFHARPL